MNRVEVLFYHSVEEEPQYERDQEEIEQDLHPL